MEDRGIRICIKVLYFYAKILCFDIHCIEFECVYSSRSKKRVLSISKKSSC